MTVTSMTVTPMTDNNNTITVLPMTVTTIIKITASNIKDRRNNKMEKNNKKYNDSNNNIDNNIKDN